MSLECARVFLEVFLQKLIGLGEITRGYGIKANLHYPIIAKPSVEERRVGLPLVQNPIPTYCPRFRPLILGFWVWDLAKF